MTNEVGFSLTQVPAYARNVKSKAMEAMAGGISGAGVGNRISIRANRFRLVQGGQDTETLPDPYLDVVIFAMAPSVQRLYYKEAYEQDSKARPTCFSTDGKVPSDESEEKQSPQCATCPQNVKGSARQGGGKACAYKKRVVMLPPSDLTGEPYAHDVNGQSMFGEQLESQNKFSFKGYYEKLRLHNVDISAIVTRLSFDDSASVPKLHFTPLRALTEEEYAVVQSRMEDDQVQLMLKDLTNEVEVEAFETAQQAKPAPQKMKATPAPAPEPVQPAAHKGVGGLVTESATPPRKGFGVKAAPAPAAAAPAPAPKPTKGVTIDLDALTNFDDA